MRLFTYWITIKKAQTIKGYHNGEAITLPEA